MMIGDSRKRVLRTFARSCRRLAVLALGVSALLLAGVCLIASAQAGKSNSKPMKIQVPQPVKVAKPRGVQAPRVDNNRSDNRSDNGSDNRSDTKSAKPAKSQEAKKSDNDRDDDEDNDGDNDNGSDARRRTSRASSDGAGGNAKEPP